MAVYERSTREALFSALYRLLQLKDIDAVRVEEVLKAAGISRSAFYRCFHDKYELLQWSYERIVTMTFSVVAEDLSVEKICRMTLQMYRDHARFFRNGLASSDVNSLRRALYDVNCEYWRNLLGMAGFDPDADGNMRVVGIYVDGAIARVGDWIAHGMRDDIEEVVAELVAAVPQRFARCLEVESTALERFC